VKPKGLLCFGNNLLAQAIMEGSCDFITELVIEQPLQRNYITYGTFRKRQPSLSKMEPFENGDTSVNTSVTEITFVFSQPMGKGYSISFSDKGEVFSPIAGVIGFSNDKKRFTIKIDLKPDHEYEFIITNRSFQSEDGFPLLKGYLIKFKTKANL
jgi:hypothetical protein